MGPLKLILDKGAVMLLWISWLKRCWNEDCTIEDGVFPKSKCIFLTMHVVEIMYNSLNLLGMYIWDFNVCIYDKINVCHPVLGVQTQTYAQQLGYPMGLSPSPFFFLLFPHFIFLSSQSLIHIPKPHPYQAARLLPLKMYLAEPTGEI